MDTKTFTVNILSEPFIEAANWTSTDAPEEVDEWVGSGLTKEPSVGVSTLCYRFSQPLHIEHSETTTRERECLQHGV